MSSIPIRIGVLRLIDCSPPIVAREYGFFADAGLEADIAVEPSWANIADKLAYGMLDAAVILGPLAIAMGLGLRGRRTALALVATLSREGNAVVLRHGADRQLEAARFAAVHAYSNHDLLLRRYLAEAGHDPAMATIGVRPPGEMVAALAAGEIDGFCAGAPWGALAARTGSGAIVAESATLAPGHPEKFVVLRADFAEIRLAAGALRAALGAATALCRAPDEAPALAHLLAAPAHLDLAEDVVRDALAPRTGNPVFMTGAALLPDRADIAWTVARMVEAGHLDPAGTDPDLSIIAS